MRWSPSAIPDLQLSHGISSSFPLLRAASARPAPIAPTLITNASMRSTATPFIHEPGQMRMPLVNVLCRRVELKMHQRGGAASPAWQDMRVFMQQCGGAAFPAHENYISLRDGYGIISIL